MNEPEPTIAQLFDLTGRAALVTGASGYLGKAMAAALAEAGCRVVVASRDQQRAEETAANLPRCAEVEHCGVAMDHTDPDSIARGFESAVQRAGSITVLVNNGHDPLGKDWSTVSFAEFTQHQANAAGYFELARHFRNHVVDQQATGSVIMLGSMYGQVASYPDVYEGITSASPAAYHALKGSILQLTRHLAVYWAQEGVRVNSLSPGAFPRPTNNPEFIAKLTEKIPLRRIGSPADLKGAIVFLASDASSYVTGHNLVVDGGWTAW